MNNHHTRLHSHAGLVDRDVSDYNLEELHKVTSLREER